MGVGRRDRGYRIRLTLSLLALFLSLAGSAYALSKGSVGSKELAKDSVTSKKIKNKQVKPSDISKKGLGSDVFKPGGVTGSSIEDGSIGSGGLQGGSVDGSKLANAAVQPGKVADFDLLGGGLTKATASASEADYATAQAAATEVPLVSRGPVSLYGKCFIDTSGPTLLAEVYARSTVTGSLLFSEINSDPGGAGGYLDPVNTENQRIVVQAAVGTDNSILYPTPANEIGVRVLAPNGSMIEAYPTVAAKLGTLAGGDVAFGPGDVCLFGGYAYG